MLGPRPDEEENQELPEAVDPVVPALVSADMYVVAQEHLFCKLYPSLCMALPPSHARERVPFPATYALGAFALLSPEPPHLIRQGGGVVLGGHRFFQMRVG